MSYYLAASLNKLRDEVNALWPNRSRVSDGWIGDTSHQARKSDHNPDYASGGVVRAIDITRSGINVDLLLKHTTNDSRVAYVIYNHRIYQHSTGWKPYYGSNPHTQHVHVSIAHTRAAERDLKTWISSKTASTTTASKPASSATKSKGIVYTNRRNAQIYKGTGKNAKLDPQQPVSQNYKLAKLGTKGKTGSWTKISWKGRTRYIPTVQVSTKKTPVIMRTNRDKVEFFSHRGKTRKSLGFAHNKGYRIALIETAGSWSRVRWSGQNAWVPTAHIDYA